MKKTNKRAAAAKICGAMLKNDAVTEKIYWAASHTEKEILAEYSVSDRGVSEAQAETLRDKYGKKRNNIRQEEFCG